MPLPGHPLTGPHRPRPGTMDHTLETPQRLRHHLRRTAGRQLKPTDETAGNTVSAKWSELASRSPKPSSATKPSDAVRSVEATDCPAARPPHQAHYNDASTAAGPPTGTCWLTYSMTRSMNHGWFSSA